jgi:MoxR-like ATPase
MQEAASHVKFGDDLIAYLLNIIEATREHDALELGASPRAAVAMRRAAQSRAAMDARDYCIPEDVRDLAVDVLSHRIIARTPGGSSRNIQESQWIMQDILEQVPVPL